MGEKVDEFIKRKINSINESIRGNKEETINEIIKTLKHNEFSNLQIRNSFEYVLKEQTNQQAILNYNEYLILLDELLED